MAIGVDPSLQPGTPSNRNRYDYKKGRGRNALFIDPDATTHTRRSTPCSENPEEVRKHCPRGAPFEKRQGPSESTPAECAKQQEEVDRLAQHETRAESHCQKVWDRSRRKCTLVQRHLDILNTTLDDVLELPSRWSEDGLLSLGHDLAVL